ncbi:hypothetical protein FACS1894159_02790 [Bacteroidia bacterium]|nr:hypothetical protein FACS1894159_02790 [Bacteroidia bacterium]
MKKYLLTLSMTLSAAIAMAQNSVSGAAVDSEKLVTALAQGAAAADTPADTTHSLMWQRHKFEFNATLQANMTTFDNWAAGGQNTTSGRGTLLVSDQYHRSKLWIINQLSTRYGISVLNNVAYKNEDELRYAFLSMWQFSNTWAYSFTLNFRTQYTKGYDSPQTKVLISNFMAPGYLDLALGATFKKEGFPLTFSISPVATSTMTVFDNTLSAQGLNGIYPGDKSRTQIGSSLKADYDQSFLKKELRYRSSFYSFCDYKKQPNARWENTLSYALGKYFTASLYWLLYYDPYATTPMPKKLQSTYTAGVGLTYNFKNK